MPRTSAESWPSRALGLPKSLTGVFQGLLLFTLLACDTLIHYRVLSGGLRRRRLSRRRRPDPMDAIVLLIAGTMNAGTVLAIAALASSSTSARVWSTWASKR